MVKRSAVKGTSSSSVIGANLMTFLKEKVNSFIKWDLIRFFHDNPHTQETAENIAAYIGRDPRTIEHELSGLVNTQVLTQEDVSGHKIYRLVDDEQVLELIDVFMEACHDRQFRVEAIHYVIQGMQFSPGHDF